MKIELAWVDALLSRWGRWALRCESGALGFAASCSLGGGDLHTNEDGYHSAEPRGLVDDDMEAVDGAVRKLPKGLRMVIIEVYQHSQGKSDRKIAECLGFSRQALQEYVVHAHRKIALDISVEGSHNCAQSSNLDSCLQTIKPVLAHA